MLNEDFLIWYVENTNWKNQKIFFLLYKFLKIAVWSSTIHKLSSLAFIFIYHIRRIAWNHSVKVFLNLSTLLAYHARKSFFFKNLSTIFRSLSLIKSYNYLWCEIAIAISHNNVLQFFIFSKVLSFALS